MADGEVRHIEMTWRCTSCKHQNLGRYKTCQSCGDPKDGSEEYEMPADTTKAASVTDAALLRMATAGPDWRCAYCGSDQRRDEGSCAQCGASALASPQAEEPDLVAPSEIPEDVPQLTVLSRRQERLIRRTAVGVGGALVAFIALGGILKWNANRPRNYGGEVIAVTWAHQIDVERYAVYERDDFKENIPSEAFETASVGQKLHNYESVFDHMETEHYTEEVPDGYRSESYTENVACGEDCREERQSCHEECTNDRNGFASCHQECSGGGQHCTTRYCNESRTREIPKTRTEYRTREVPKYRQEPRYAEAFHFKVWEWQKNRSVEAHGADTTNVIWPDGAMTTGLPDGNREREQRIEKYTVMMKYRDHQVINFGVRTAAEFARFALGSKHDIHTEKQHVSVDGAAIQPLP